MNEVSIRASSLGDLFDCAKRWEARNILNIRMPTSGAAYLGTSIHAGTAAFDQAVLNRAAISIDDATGVMVDTLYHPNEDVAWDDIKPAKAEPVARQLLNGYCNVIAPQREYIAVEAKCENMAIDIDGVILTLSGTVDRVRRNKYGDLGISDIKTGKYAVATDGTVNASKHAIQLGVYEILAFHSLQLQINGTAEVIGLCTNSTARIGTGTRDRPRDLLLGDDDNAGLLQLAAGIIKAGVFPPNSRSNLCSEKYCPIYRSCPYK